MVTQEMYNRGLRCRGICQTCNEDINSCYQYITDVKGTKFDVKFDMKFTEKKQKSHLDRDVEILIEIIADNLEVIKQHGDIDVGIFEDVCDKLGFDLYSYINKYIPGHFKS